MFASLNPGFPADNVEKSGQGLFDNPLVNSALALDAECIVDIPKTDSTGFPEIVLRNNFDFGFIQGINKSSHIFEFWGKTARHGRTTTVFTMPPSLKLDIEPGTNPFTRAASSRFGIRNVTRADANVNPLLISANFSDHPMLAFDHTIKDNRDLTQFIRSVAFRRDFRTIFCFRNKTGGFFTGLSSTNWTFEFRHLITHSNNGKNRALTGRSNVFPRGGSVSNLNAIDRQLLDFAKNGGPAQSHADFNNLIGDRSPARTVTREDVNPDFEDYFFK